MDNLALDMMLDEYEEGQKDAAEEIMQHRAQEARRREPSPPPPPAPPPPSSPSTDEHNSIFTEDTVPVSSSDEASETTIQEPREAVDSSSSSSSAGDFNRGSSGSSSGGVSSLYQPGFTAPTINYERDRADQKLVAVIGREFDQPIDVARNLQEVLGELENAESAKFVPFMVKRKTLLRGSFNTKELGNHDLICLCYNASEARILLTGQDGFYTTLLKQIEALLGPNKVAFLISNYTAPLSSLLENEEDPTDIENSQGSLLISNRLKTRLYHQEPLRIYLEQNQVLSWCDEPEGHHVQRLMQLANLETNPRSIFAANSCSII